MGGGGGTQEVKYVGPTKEELAQKQAQYDQQISLMQEQNKAVQSKYDLMRSDSEKALAERTTLMQGELARQQKSYDEVLGTTKQALTDSKLAQEKQGTLMSELTGKQEQAGKLQTAQAEKETIQTRDAMNLNKRSVDAANKAVNTRRRRRGLMSTMSNPMTT
jgi:hypothetical protein